MASKAKKKPRPQTPGGAEAKPFVTTMAALPNVDTSGQRLCWRFGHVDHDGPWGFDSVEPGTLCWILTCLRKFESMTLNEVFHNGGYPGKDYNVPDLPNKLARDRLEDLKLSDMTKIHCLRLQGQPRLYGFLHENIFHVIWWDPEHEVWESKLKHT